MFEDLTESEAREKILAQVKEYCDKYHTVKEYTPGDRINYAGRVYDSDEMTNLVDSALKFRLTADEYAERFEKGLAEFLGVRHCLAVNSGSSANLLAFYALTSPLLESRAIKRGDEVITVAAGFPTTVAPIIQFGAVPVFVDVTIPQYNIDVEILESAYSEKTKAVMLAHTLGNPFNIKAVTEFCSKHNLWLIEDNCDALGSTYSLNEEIKLTGTFGDIGTSSFYPPHHMTMGEGGAVYTDNPLLFKIMRSLRDWGRDCICPPGKDNFCGHRFEGVFGELPRGYDHKYVYSHFGFNLKATDMQCAVGCAQLHKLPEFISRRKENFNKLYDRLSGVNNLILPQKCPDSDPSWFGFLMTCKKDGDRDKIVANLEKNNIQTRMLFAGNITRHPCFDSIRQNGEAYRICGSLENTDKIMNNTFWVGVYPGMTDEMLDETVKRIIEAVS